MRKKLGLGTLESRIHIFFILMLFAAIFIMQLVFFRFATTTVKRSKIENNRTLLRQLVSQIDSYIMGIDIISQKIVDDDRIQQYLETHINLDSLEKIEERLYYYMEARSDISNILIYANDGRSILGDPESKINPWTDIKESSWYNGALSENGQTSVSTAYVQNIFLGKYSWVVSLSREILSKKSGESLGVLLVDLKFNRIEELCRSLVIGEKGYDFIIDSSGAYVFHPSQQLVNSNLRKEPIYNIQKLINNTSSINYFQNNDRYFMVETSDLTNWNIVSVTHNNDIITDWKNVQVIYTLIGLVLFLIVGPVTKRISSGITEPIRKLQNIMKTVESGEFKLIGSIKATDEIRKLAYDYDIMVGRIRELMESNSREHELKRKSDLKALQAQINPHFLYNTLDSIIWMGEMGQNKEVVRMTSALSKLFRISISKGHEIITIRDEIAHVKSYLTIQEMRYQDRFRYLIDIDPDLLDLPILKITLQPIVENAIYHGIKEGNEAGFIKITSSIQEDFVLLKVEDNGIGMSQTDLKSLISGVNMIPGNSLRMSKQGMGLRNVHQRIKLYFGKQYGLTFESSPGKGSIITASIPRIKKEYNV